MKPVRIILLGYMGSGKTTVGKALSRELNMPFYDLDWYIEGRMRKTIRQIFDERGEEEFRKIERNMLHEVAEFENVVISCGGGTPCFFDSFYLKCTPDVLYAHLKMGKTIRPLLLNKTPDEVQLFISEQLAQREVFYSRARHIVDVTLMDSYQKINITVSQIRSGLGV